MTDFVVTNTNDSGSGSFRQAIIDANNSVGIDTISFDLSLEGESIDLSNGELTITDGLKIDGDLNDDSIPDITINANNQSRVFNINDSNINIDQQVDLSGLIITGGEEGRNGLGGAGILNYENLNLVDSVVTGNSTRPRDLNASTSGGGILNFGDLQISRSSFADNYAQRYGGGIANEGTVTIDSSSFTGNTANRSGGGLRNGSFDGFSRATVSNSTFTNNSAQYGGGIESSFNTSINVSSSTISNNQSLGGAGGGISNNGNASIVNSTISFNEVDDRFGYLGLGGGIFTGERLSINNSTVSNNSGVEKGGGITIEGTTLDIQDTIVANNSTISGAPDIFIQFGGDIRARTSLIEDGELTTDLGGNIVGVDPLLDPEGLKDNGGPTETIALLPNSPALDRGSNLRGLEFDQRGVGFLREINGRADIGAFEVQDSGPITSTPLLLSIKRDDRINGLSVKNEDIIMFDGEDFNTFFDGSDVGLGNRAISAFDVISPNEILISLDRARRLPGVAGKVRPQDVIKFTATSLGEHTEGQFSMYFDGSDMGLFGANEKIDAITGSSNGGSLLLSTAGSLSAKGRYRANKEDISRFNPTQLGEHTKGQFSKYFDGSDVGLGNNNVDAFSLDSEGDLVFSTRSPFNSGSLSAEAKDVFEFTPISLGSRTQGTFSSDVLFDGSQVGLSRNNVLGVDLTF